MFQKLFVYSAGGCMLTTQRLETALRSVDRASCQAENHSCDVVAGLGFWDAILRQPACNCVIECEIGCNGCRRGAHRVEFVLGFNCKHCSKRCEKILDQPVWWIDRCRAESFSG